MLGVTLGPASGRAVAEFVRTGQRPDVLAPFRFDRK
jgi:D-amino-acid dehydrogenase